MDEDEREFLRRLADEHAIRRVIMTYPRGQDRGDGETIASIYFDDAYDFHGGSGFLKGTEYGDISVKRMETVKRHFTMHFMGDTFYEFDDTGDVCHTESYVRANHGVEREGQPYLELFFGRYLDRFERREGVWKIAQRVTVRDYMCATPVESMMPDRPFQGSRSTDDISFAHLRMERIPMDLP